MAPSGSVSKASVASYCSRLSLRWTQRAAQLLSRMRSSLRWQTSLRIRASSMVCSSSKSPKQSWTWHLSRTGYALQLTLPKLSAKMLCSQSSSTTRDAWQTFCERKPRGSVAFRKKRRPFVGLKKRLIGRSTRSLSRSRPRWQLKKLPLLSH